MPAQRTNSSAKTERTRNSVQLPSHRSQPQVVARRSAVPAQKTNSSTKKERQGLELAERLFGPLLHPIVATQNAWNNYSLNRLKTNEKRGNVLSGSGEDDEEDEYHSDGSNDYDMDAWLSKSIKSCVSQIESEMDLDVGTLQKCLTILSQDTELDDSDPRSANHIVRIYSPTAPMYIDVHFCYYCRPRSSEVEWFYTLGYKIQHRPPANAANVSAIKKEFVEGRPSDVHTRNGWQTLCWGYFDDSNGNYGESWRRIELGEVELNKEGVLDIYETLFGELEKPTGSTAKLAYRQSLVRGVRLLLAAAGISYEVACTNDETDKRHRGLMLEGLSDKWVGRGIRTACGFQLKRDAEEAKQGAQERQEEAEGNRDSEEEEEEEEEMVYIPMRPLRRRPGIPGPHQRNLVSTNVLKSTKN